MRPRIALLVILLAVMAIVAPRIAQAQWVQGQKGGHSDNPNGPTTSPYLNLLQNNNFGGANYQTLVKPLIDQPAAIQRQGASLQRLQNQVNSQQFGGGGSRAGTGHTTFFMNRSHFYSSGSRGAQQQVAAGK